MAEIVIVIGYILFFWLAVTSCSVFYYFIYLQKPSSAINAFATSLPPTTPTPQIPLVYSPNPESILFQDDFANNQNRWGNGMGESTQEIKDGKLFYESSNDYSYAIIGCEPCTYIYSPYYFEADFSTKDKTDESYGIAFSLSYTKDEFYLFIINPESRKYFLYHKFSGEWSLRSAGESGLIQAYPEVNTLGLLAQRSVIELYINNEIVDSYTETNKSFYPGLFGFYVNNTGLQVIIDNLTIYKIKN